MADPAALIRRARTAYAAQDMARAVEAAAAAAKAAPDNAGVAFLHAQIYIKFYANSGAMAQ